MAGMSQCTSSVISSSAVGGHRLNARICTLKSKGKTMPPLRTKRYLPPCFFAILSTIIPCACR
eukprot:13339991-Ditylum_brightwellii.AAC.1